jgi:acyl-CoA synthetase (AMP-forming)/AMP-acid ligase II
LCKPNWPNREEEDSNFAGRLLRRLSKNSCLIDAPTDRVYAACNLPNLIVGFADGFLGVGLRAGDRLLIHCEVSAVSTLAYLGAMYAGVIPVLVEERIVEAQGDSLLRQVRPRAIWTARSQGNELIARQGISEIVGEFAQQDVEMLPACQRDESDLAALMLTSGSTGAPRMVMVSHGNLIANTEAIIRSQGLGRDERAMLIMPIAYCFGASVMQTHLYRGGGVVFDSRFMFPDRVLRAIDQYGCTTFAGVPSVYNALLHRSNLVTIAIPSLRRFLQAGGALDPNSVRQVREAVPSARFFVMYGQTEATARISSWDVDSDSNKLGSAGMPLDNLELRIADPEGRELAPGETGEIQVRGPSVCGGYLDDPEATAQKFADGWLKTRDYGLRDKDGYLWIKGRAEDFIKIRGRRVGLGEIEAKVGSVPGVSECAALPVEDKEAGEAVALFLVPKDGESGLVERVRGCLPPLWTCAAIRLVQGLPRTSSGKLARSQLRAML